MNKDCVLASLCVGSIIALAMSLNNPVDSLLKQNSAMIKQQIDQSIAAQDDALEAKRLELQALETARAAEAALADAKKKLASCR